MLPPVTRERLSVLRVWGPLIFAAIVLAPQFGLVLAPVPVAVGIARGSFAHAGLALVGMTAAAAIGYRDPSGAFVGFIAGGLGVPLGIWIASGISFGRCVARMAALAGSLVVTMLFASADSVDDNLDRELAAFEERIAEDSGETTAEASQVIDLQRRIVENWPYLLPGMAIALITWGACVSVALASRLIARAGGAPVPGRFRDMRPPEWLVWVAIAAALLWFVDSEQSNEWARLLSWNTGLALAGVYWLNGLGIFLTMAVAYQWPWMLTAILTLLLVLPQTGPILAIAGFFDTWVEFRRRLQRRNETEFTDNGDAN